MKNIENQEKIEYLNDNIVRTKKVFRVGPGEFDLIGIDRIRKHECGCPRATVIMLPGSNSNFSTSFEKMALFLAKHHVDVWGVDFRYTFVPDNTSTSPPNPYCMVTGCTFMQNWDTNLHLSDLDMVVKMAELSAPGGKVFILGWSQGAFFAYRYAISHPELKGIIPIDIVYNLDPIFTEIADKARAEIAARRSKISQGIYYEEVLLAKFIAAEALTNPDSPSTVIPGLTNRQAALFTTTATYQLGASPIPNFRYNQGDLTGLKYTDLQFALQQSITLNNFQSIYPITEIREQWLDLTIPSITVPILYVGAELGFGIYGFYTPNMIHNTNPDVETYLVPDYGHVDIVYSNTGAEDLWRKIYRWIMTHSEE